MFERGNAVEVTYLYGSKPSLDVKVWVIVSLIQNIDCCFTVIC